MALEGSLQEFGLADILQLIYFQRKTGVLTIASKQDNVRLLFNNGNVIFAASKVRDESMRTGRMLVKKGIISADDLKKALAEQKGVRLGAYLIRSNMASKEQVQEALTVQITETVFQLFSWKEGKYEFKPQGVPVDKDIGLSIDTQHLLMEGLRLLDEWSLLKGKLSTDSVVEKTGAGTEGLSPEEGKLLELVDGEADVSAIAGYSGMDSLQVSKALLALIEKGAIAKKEEASPEAKAAPSPIKAAKPLTGSVAVLSVIIALVVTLLSFFAAEFDIRGFGVSAEMEKSRVMIEAKRYETGSYPLSITEEDPWGNRYIYELKERGFTLRSSGPDGVAGNADDVR